jgi:hypothetical protein
MIQSSLFDLIKPLPPVAPSVVLPVTNVPRSTSAELVGKKVIISFYTREITATIDSKDTIYPDTAYRITWTKQDNPDEDIPADCAGMTSVIHYNSVTRQIF